MFNSINLIVLIVYVLVENSKNVYEQKSIFYTFDLFILFLAQN